MERIERTQWPEPEPEPREEPAESLEDDGTPGAPPPRGNDAA